MNMTVSEAMRQINSNARGILYITDDEGRLVGSLTDGDVRRWLIKSSDLSAEVGKVMFTNTKYLTEKESDSCWQFMRDAKMSSVPILNDDHVVVDIRFKKGIKWVGEKLPQLSADTPIIIMAGGRGTRLKPYTNILPKPLIPIGEQPIIERIMNRFADYGGKVFYLVINYKKEIIKAYFSESKHDYTIKYIDEIVPLGTAGGIRLIDDVFDKPVIISNCDVLIEVDYVKLYEYHKSSGNALTIVSAVKDVVIPYGILNSKENGEVVSMEEKPSMTYYINTGMYIINPEYIDWIPEGVSSHMTDLAKHMMDSGKKVGLYLIDKDEFFDMGEFEELKRMEEWVRSAGGEVD